MNAIGPRVGHRRGHAAPADRLAGLGSRVEPAVAGMALASLATSRDLRAAGVRPGRASPRHAGRRRAAGWAWAQQRGAGSPSPSHWPAERWRCPTWPRPSSPCWARPGGHAGGDLEHVLEGSRGAGLVLALVSIGLVAGVAEEIFFRGLVQRTLERRLAGVRGGAVLAVLTASAAFALAHWDPVHTPGGLLPGALPGGRHPADRQHPARHGLPRGQQPGRGAERLLRHSCAGLGRHCCWPASWPWPAGPWRWPGGSAAPAPSAPPASAPFPGGPSD